MSWLLCIACQLMLYVYDWEYLICLSIDLLPYKVFLKCKFSSWAIEYSFASIELLVNIFRPKIKLVWLLTFFHYLCRWCPLVLTSLGKWIGGLMKVMRNYVLLCICGTNMCTIWWACALNFIFETMYSDLR